MPDPAETGGRAKIWVELTRRGNTLKQTTAARCAARKRLNTAIDRALRAGAARAAIRDLLGVSDTSLDNRIHRIHTNTAADAGR